MADEKLLHAEDVIFNKPSLKELIRLIKNGTINAIWPSTQEEFNAWNDPDNEYGYKAYIDESKQRTEDRLKLKSLNTSMTIYYGDNQDTISTDDLKLEETNKKYNKVIESINGQKEEIVDLNYFDSIEEIYPTNNNNLTLTLNSTTGKINNAEKVINYKNNILNEYRKNIQKVNDLINRINNFKTTAKITYNLEDQSIYERYYNFFTNSINKVNDNFNAITVSEWNARDDIKEKLVDTQGEYHFDYINCLYESKINIKNQLQEYLKQYYLNDNDLFSFNNEYHLNLQILSQEYQLYKTQLNNDIATFYDSWEEACINNLQFINHIAIPYIYIENLSTSKKEEYEKDINLLYEDYVLPYENLIKYYYILVYNGEKTISQATNFWDTTLSTLKENVNKVSSLELKINTINEKFVTEMNVYRQNINIPIISDFNIIFLQGGAIKDSAKIMQNLEYAYNYLKYSETALNDYESLIPSIFLPRSKNDLTTYLNNKNAIRASINTLVSENATGITKVSQDQTQIISLYTNFMQEYENLIDRIKNLEIVSVDYPADFDLSVNGIDNKTNILNAIIDQESKILNHYNALILLGYDNLTGTINTFTQDVRNIYNEINNAKVLSIGTGKEQDFIDQVINPDKQTTEDDYTMEIVDLLLKRITNNTISFEEDEIIPKISTDFLRIENKDIVIKNLYLILNTGEQLNREYILMVKIDNINTLLTSWYPCYNSQNNSHYTCIAVGSDIQFEDEIAYPGDDSKNTNTNEARKDPLVKEQVDGTITIKINKKYHYPKINGLTIDPIDSAHKINSNTRNSQVVTVGGLASLFGGDGKITERNIGSTYIPMYLSNGMFTPCAGVISGNYNRNKKGEVTYWEVIHPEVGNVIGLAANKLFGAVYNDYAEYRSAIAKPGQCVIENGDGTLSPSTKRLQLGANIVSDTYGFAIGETNDATCPIAVSGRVLALPLEDKILYAPGAAVCSGPNGTISLMTREEIREWPDAIVGYVSEIPTYDTWGTENVPVNERIWIKIK